MTVAKSRGGRGGGRRSGQKPQPDNKIRPASYAAFADRDFGVQRFDRLQLLDMVAPKDGIVCYLRINCFSFIG
jgi:hypothetical protein